MNIPKRQIEKLCFNGLPSNASVDHFPVIKFFVPGTKAKWLLTLKYEEFENLFFGLCDLGLGYAEVGDISLDDLENCKAQIDCDFKPKYPLSVYAKGARSVGYITEDESILQKFKK